MTYTWDQFTRKIYIKASVSELFDRWTKSDQIITWFIKECVYQDLNGKARLGTETCQEGDEYYWKWHQDLETRGKILKVIPDQLFSFTFGKKDELSGEFVIVDVQFQEESKTESSFTLKQSNMGGPDLIKAEYHLSCNMGWSFFMTNLKALVEHAADLREFDSKRAHETRALSL